MRSAIAVLSGAALVAAAPYNPFPLDSGFPAPDASQLAQIELEAGGTLPNGALPSTLTAAGALTLQLLAANEIFEVAYFNSLLSNITNGVPGYEDGNTEYVKKVFKQIRAQEELHALGVNGILKNAGQPTIEACNYTFPVDNYKDAVNLANVFTDVVLSVLPVAQTQFASDGGDEAGLVQLFGSVIAQEGEQNGWYRSVAGKVPSAAPFLTSSSPAFAASALALFIVPGSCPNLNLITDSIPIFPPLTVVSGAKATTEYNSTVMYSAPLAVDASVHSIAYITGQNLPIVVPITNVQASGNSSTFEAILPFSEGFAKGFSVAALVTASNGTTFADAAAVANATLAGPGLVLLD